MKNKIAVLIVLLAQIACTITLHPQSANSDVQTVSTISTYRRASEITTYSLPHLQNVQTHKERP